MRVTVRLGVALALLGAGGRLFAAGGTLTDGAVSLTYSAAHWNGQAAAHFTGTRPTGSDDVLSASGWWYRLNNIDTREYPLPVPTSESYSGGFGVLTYTNVDGKDFDVTEYVQLTDNEGPSGTYSSGLCVQNNHGSPLSLSLFHYLDADANGTFAGDHGFAVRPYLLTFSETDTIAYRSANDAAAFMARPYGAADDLLTRLNDNAADTFDNSGLPTQAPTDLAAGYQWNLTIPDGASVCYAAQVIVASRQLRLLTKGDLGGDLNYSPDIFMEKPSTGELISWNMKRAGAFQTTSYGNLPPNRGVVGVDDFRGTYLNQLLTRDRVTGAVYLDGQQLQAPTLALNWQLAATGDLDADGKADIVWRNLSSQKIVVWRMDGLQRLGALTPTPDQAQNGNWEIVGATDFDGDGTRDLLWYNVSSGNLVIWFLNNSLVRTSATFTNPASAGGVLWRPVAAGDYGAGPGGLTGTQDILWRNSVSGKLVVWHMDFAGVRTSGEFTAPDSPSSPATEWQVVGPR